MYLQELNVLEFPVLTVVERSLQVSPSTMERLSTVFRHINLSYGGKNGDTNVQDNL